MTEHTLYKWLSQYWVGHYTRVENSCSAGLPDINSVLDGREIWVEVKATKRDVVKMRKYQRVWSIRHTLSGGLVHVLNYDQQRDEFQLWTYPDIAVNEQLVIIESPRLRIKRLTFIDQRTHLFGLLHAPRGL